MCAGTGDRSLGGPHWGGTRCVGPWRGRHAVWGCRGPISRRAWWAGRCSATIQWGRWARRRWGSSCASASRSLTWTSLAIRWETRGSRFSQSAFLQGPAPHALGVFSLSGRLLFVFPPSLSFARPLFMFFPFFVSSHYHRASRSFVALSPSCCRAPLRSSRLSCLLSFLAVVLPASCLPTLSPLASPHWCLPTLSLRATLLCCLPTRCSFLHSLSLSLALSLSRSLAGGGGGSP